MEALERQLATVLRQVGEAEERRIRAEETVKAELAAAAARHDGGIEALRSDLAEQGAWRASLTNDLAKQEAWRESLTSDLADLVDSLSASRAGHSGQIAEMRQLLGPRIEQGKGQDSHESTATGEKGDELLLLQSRAIKVLHVELGRLARRFDLDAEEAVKTTAALMERIEDFKTTAGRSRDAAASTGGVRT